MCGLTSSFTKKILVDLFFKHLCNTQ